MLFPTNVVVSYPQPEWMIDRQRLAGSSRPGCERVELWRVKEAFMAARRTTATIMAITWNRRMWFGIIKTGRYGARANPILSRTARRWSISQFRALRLDRRVIESGAERGGAIRRRMR